MSGPAADGALIRSQGQVEAFARECFRPAGESGPGADRVGAELEFLVFDRADPARQVPIARLAEALRPVTPLPGGSRITFEPGGQLELSGRAASLPGSLAALAGDVAAVRAALDGAGLVLAGIGLDPVRPARRQLRLPRYEAMAAYLAPPYGPLMMCSTASIQVNLDLGGHPAERWRRAHLLGPVLMAAFSNSPLREGRPSGWMSGRQQVWAHLDPTRTSPVPATADPSEGWAAYLLAARVMLRRDPADASAPPDPDGLTYVPVSDGSTFADWIADPARHGRPPTLADLTYHATTLFPPVRPRGWLEIRYLDAQHPSLWPVCVAVTHALIMDDHAADTALTAIEAHGISPDPPSTTPHTATPPENATRTATGNGATSTDAAPTVIENGAARADTGPTVIENGGATRADATPTATGNGTAYTDAALSPAGTPTEIGTTTETGAATKTGAASAPAVPGRPISAPDGTGSPTTGPGSGGAPADIWQDAARCGLADPRLRRAAEVCFAAALDALPRLGAGPELIRMVADYADRYVRTGRSPAATLIELSTADGGLTPSGLLPHLLEAGGVNSPPPGSARPASEATAPAPPTGPAAPAAREVREVPAAQKGLDALGTHEAWTALASQEALSAPTASDTVSAPASREAQATQEALSAPAAREAAPRPAVRGAAAGRAARASQETSAQETSAQETSAEEASIQQTSAEEASAQEASTLQTSTQEASVQAASAQPAPAVPASRGRGRAGPRRPDPGAHALAAVSPSGPEGTP